MWRRVGVALVGALAVLGCAARSERTVHVTDPAPGVALAAGSDVDRQQRELEQVLLRQDRIAREGDTLRASLSSDILFERGSARLQPDAGTRLLQIAGVLQRYPGTHVEVAGHTDNRGSEASNQELSEERAAAVRDNLVKGGVDGARVSTRGDGEQRPVASNETATGRAANRRIDITIRPDEAR